MRIFLALGAWAALTAAMVTANAAPARHVIIISIDGLHQADLLDPMLQDRWANVLAVAHQGIWYNSASASVPSDSMPGTLAYLTGAGPATTGVYYDVAYSRTLLAPDGATTGTRILIDEAIDKDATRLDGGGNFGAASLDPAKLPRDPGRGAALVYPHDLLKVNTIFEVAHAAGLRTVMMDKHPAYEIAAGPSGNGVDDLYCPEIDAKAALVDGKLLDVSAAPAGTKLKSINKDADLAMAYDDLKIAALVREIHGQDTNGRTGLGAPGLAAVNLQAVTIAEKIRKGGIDQVDGKQVVSKAVLRAIQHNDADIAMVVSALKSAGIWDQTLLIVTAKHGQNPRVGEARLVKQSVITDALQKSGIALASQTLDDVALLWLADRSKTSRAADVLHTLAMGSNNPGIAEIYWGQSLQAAHLAGPDDRTPDIIVSLQPGVLLTDSSAKRSDHGGFCDDDRHVPIILGGGAIDAPDRGAINPMPVQTTQIAVTALVALGLNPAALQGAQLENTQALPNDGLESAVQANYKP
jgi:hypothetical protein